MSSKSRRSRSPQRSARPSRIAPALVAGSLLLAGTNSSGLADDERCRLFPTAAALDASGLHWRIPVRAWVYETECDDPLRAALLAPIRKLLELKPGTPECERFLARARWFLVDNERHEHPRLHVGDARFRLGPTDPGGHCTAVVDLPVTGAPPVTDGAVALPLTIGAGGDPTGCASTAWLVPPTGLTVLSDLDDTVKVTEVRDRDAALRNTFVAPFRAVPGMAALYRDLAARGAFFHYCSLSPWQLEPPLAAFLLEAGFPPGPLELQRFRLKDASFFELFENALRRKLELLTPLLERWPGRRFVLIGDSGQSDPEVYGELARRFPDRIAAILIRAVTDEPADAPRFAAAFRATAALRWQLFREPAEVRLDALLAPH